MSPGGCVNCCTQSVDHVDSVRGLLSPHPKEDRVCPLSPRREAVLVAVWASTIGYGMQAHRAAGAR
jgi:hypothetical protein